MNAERPQHADDGSSLKRILIVVIPLGLLIVAVVMGLAVLGNPFAGLGGPNLVMAKGKVTLGGQPLPSGSVTTRLADGSIAASGIIKEDGSFKLETDVNGRFVDGAVVGEHTVTIAATSFVASGASAPPILTPAKYNSPKDTPLRITIDRDASKNANLVLAMEGDPLTLDDFKGDGSGDGPPTGGGGSDPRSRAGAYINDYDADKDGFLTVSELMDLEQNELADLLKADADGDGKISADELIQHLQGG